MDRIHCTMYRIAGLFLWISVVMSSLVLSKVQSEVLSELSCPDGWLRLNNSSNSTNPNKCVHYSKKRFNFTSAQAYCRRNLNSSLMAIRSRQENREISKLLFEELKFDENFWLNGRVADGDGAFVWLNDTCMPNFGNFHTNNHQFNVNELNEEYLVISSALNENSHSKKRERGTWCSFAPSIMFVALCEHYLPGGSQSNGSRSDCKLSQSTGDQFADDPKGDFRQSQLLNELLYPARSFVEITRTQAYFVIASTLMIILLIGMCLILRAKFIASRRATNANVSNFNESEMY